MENKNKKKKDTMGSCPRLSSMSLLCLLSVFPVLNAETHSLTYIYTAFSRPSHSPGIHQFTAMGLVDGKMIDYFDSDLKQKVPKQPWMEKNMDKSYWEKGTQSRMSKQKWFNVNIDILMKRLRQNDSDTHILQWLHGCESATVDGAMKFYRGVDRYSYDGKDFLHFDDDHGVWVSTGPAAEETKRKWDLVQTLMDYTKGYLERECLNWLERFMAYGQKQLQAAPKPDMFMFAKKSTSDISVILTCLATGFLQKHATLEMRRSGRLLTEVDGVQSSGVRPNNGNTFQIRHSVEILKTDQSLFTCEVLHKESQLSALTTWDHKLPDDGSESAVYIGLGVLVVLVAVVAVILVVLYKCTLFKSSLRQGKDTSGTASALVPEGTPLNPNTEDRPPNPDTDSSSSLTSGADCHLCGH